MKWNYKKEEPIIDNCSYRLEAGATLFIIAVL